MKNRKKMVGIMVMAALAVLLSVSAYGQGPENIAGAPFLGVFPNAMPGGTVSPVGWDNNRGPNALVGSLIGGFLGYMIQENQYRNQDRYYSDRDRAWERDRNRNQRYYKPDNRRYGNRYPSRYNPNCPYDTTPRDRYSDRYWERYPR